MTATTQQQPSVFNPSEHLMPIKNKNGSSDYLPVQWRLVWFREQCPSGTIDTEEVEVDLEREVEEESFAWNADKRRSEKVVKRSKGYARFRAVVTDGKGGRATGTKSENAASFPDYIEKAETGAIGRALAALGYGTQFVGEEFSEGHRIVDTPVDMDASSPTEETPVVTTTSTSSSSSASKTPAASVAKKVTPAMPLVSVKPTDAAGEEPKQPTNWRADIAAYKDVSGSYEWKLLCELANLPEDSATWTPEHAFQVTHVAETWLRTPIVDEQKTEMAAFRSKYGNALGLLKASIEEIADIEKVSGLMRSQAEVFLRLVREADAVIYPNGKRVDADMKIAKSVDPEITHPLLFVCPTRTGEQKPGLKEYQQALEATLTKVA